MRKDKSKHARPKKQRKTILKEFVTDRINPKAFAEAAIQSDRRHGPQRRKETTILQTAERLIYRDRNKVYKHPTENFGNIAALHNAYFRAINARPDQDGFTCTQLNQVDIAIINILQKIARMATAQDHIDSVIDIAGYAGCIERIISIK